MGKVSSRWRSLLVGLGVVVSFAVASAQTMAVLKGTIVDESGGAIVGAQITVTDSTGVVRGRAVTNDTGAFTASGLTPGQYVVNVEKALFDPARLTVDVGGQTAPVTITLRIAGLTESVSVAVPKLDERPTGQTVTTIERAQFKNATGFSIGEIVVYSPGVTVSQGNGPRDVSVSVRGSNIRQTFGIRNIQVLEDGFPVTQPDGLARTDLIDPHAYAGIDVFRGPSSALYGNYAVEGAVNFRTRSGADINGFEALVDGGSFGYTNVAGAYGHQGQQYDIAGFASYVNGDGFTAHTSYHTTTESFLAHYAPSESNKFTFKFVNNDLFTNLSIRLSLNQYNANPHQDGCGTLAGTACASVSLFANGFNGTRVSLSPEQAGLQRHDRRTIVAGRWEHLLSKATMWRTQLVWDNRDITQPTSATSAVGTYPSFNFSSDVTQSGHLGSVKATHFAGVYANYENISGSTYNVAPGGNATLGGLSATTYGHHANAGVRAREEVQFDAHWTAIAGLSIERTGLNALNTGYAYPTNASPTTTVVTADRTFTNVAPEAAVFYRPVSALQVRAGVSAGFGTPQVSNLFVTPDGVNGNNTQLESQTNVGVDAGADVHVGRMFTATVAAYREAFHNELVTQSPGANLLSYTYNAPRSTHNGLELTADARPWPDALPGLHAQVSYTWMDQHYVEYVERLSAGNQSTTFDRSGNKIPGVPPNNISGRIGWDQPSGRAKGLGGYLEVSYRDSAFMDNANLLKVPGYTLWNLNLHYDPASGSTARDRLHLLLEIRNLTDQVYVASASNIADSINSTTGLQNPASTLANTTGSIWAGAPRSIFAGARVRF